MPLQPTGALPDSHRCRGTGRAHPEPAWPRALASQTLPPSLPLGGLHAVLSHHGPSGSRWRLREDTKKPLPGSPAGPRPAGQKPSPSVRPVTAGADACHAPGSPEPCTGHPSSPPTAVAVAVAAPGGAWPALHLLPTFLSMDRRIQQTAGWEGRGAASGDLRGQSSQPMPTHARHNVSPSHACTAHRPPMCPVPGLCRE